MRTACFLLLSALIAGASIGFASGTFADAPNQTKQLKHKGDFTVWMGGLGESEFKNAGPWLFFQRIKKEFGFDYKRTYMSPNVIAHINDDIDKDIKNKSNKELYKYIKYFVSGSEESVNYLYNKLNNITGNKTCLTFVDQNFHSHTIDGVLIIIERKQSDFKRTVCLLKGLLEGMGLEQGSVSEKDFFEHKETYDVLVKEEVYARLKKRYSRP